MCVFVSGYVHTSSCTLRVQKRMANALELELQVFLRHLIFWEPNSGSSAGAASTLSGQAFSPAPVAGYFVKWSYFRIFQILCVNLAGH